MNYTLTEKEFLVLVFGFKNSRLNGKEFNYEIKDKKGADNPLADLLSRIVMNDASESPICDCSPMSSCLGFK